MMMETIVNWHHLAIIKTIIHSSPLFLKTFFQLQTFNRDSSFLLMIREPIYSW